MANIKSQIKRNRQNEVRRIRNKGARSTLKTKIKGFLEAAESGDRPAAEERCATPPRLWTRRLPKA